METYPTFFTPRDKEPSHSSSEKNSSEFDWLEIKITRKQKYEGKAEQVLYKIYFFKTIQKVVSENKLPRFCKVNYKTIYKRLLTLCSYLLTKEFNDWWITRRKCGFKHQIFEAKNLKVSVTNIWKHSGGFHRHARWL